MANIFGSINGFGHGAYTQLFQHMLLGFTLYIFQHLVK